MNIDFVYRNTGGMFEVHAQGCRDAVRVARYYDQQTPFTAEIEDLIAAAEWMYGETSEDNNVKYSIGWWQEVREGGLLGAEYKPCMKELPLASAERIAQGRVPQPYLKDVG
ncbi:hypothetical protein ACFC1T_09185 [Kitasatospora sp. NPDC056076]|uniref:hypothetical protein n=1 Tax=Kitasatospora sp. NPDC056076 TaxID=3345703 RepID=UPI0035E2487D